MKCNKCLLKDECEITYSSYESCVWFFDKDEYEIINGYIVEKVKV